MADRIQFRRDTAANWQSYNPILMEGEVGFILGGESYKLGDGIHSWNDLPLRGFSGTVAQQAGDSTTSVMSQAAVVEYVDSRHVTLTEDQYDLLVQNQMIDNSLIYMTYEE